MIISNKTSKVTVLEEIIEKDANDILARYGKSFHWARRFLGTRASDQSTSLYAFCRYLDDIADNENNLDKLLKVKNFLIKQDKKCSVHPYVDSFVRLSKEINIPEYAPQDLLSGLISDQGEVLIPNEASLIKYSYQVAGTVGLMMASVLGASNQKSLAFAIDLGIAMQLTNIARDVLEDASNNRRYLPGTWCNNTGPKEILDCAKKIEAKETANISSAINRVLILAERYYQSGISGLRYLPIRNHLAIGIAAIVYRLIGRRLMKQGTMWWNGREVIGSGRKVTHSFLVMTTLISRFKKYPAHNVDLHIHLREFLNESA